MIPILLLFLISLILVMVLIRKNNISHLEHLPGPPTRNFLLGNSYELREPTTRVKTIRKWREQYGPVFKITGGLLTTSEVVLVDPELENVIMRLPNKGNGFWPFKWFMKYIARTQAMFVMDGHAWSERRKEVMTQGFMYKDLPDNFRVLTKNLRKVMHLVESKEGSTDIHLLSSVVLIDSMSESLTGHTLGCIENPTHPMVETFENTVKTMAIVQNLPFMFFLPHTIMRMLKVNVLVKAAYAEADKRFDQPEKYEGAQDFCSKLCASGVLSRKEIGSEVLGAQLAASGNPSLSITWLLFTLVNKPHILRKIEQEIESVVGSRSEMSYDEIKSMQYLSNVANETFRVFIPDAIHRLIDSDTELHGHVIPAGTQLWIPSFLSHFEHVGENPFDFDPDRYSTGDNIRTHPFGGGPRICLGHMWTRMALKTVVAHVVHNFHISLDANNPPVVPEFHMLLFESAKIKFNFRAKEGRYSSYEADGADEAF